MSTSSGADLAVGTQLEGQSSVWDFPRAVVAAIDPDVGLLTEPGAWWQAQVVPLPRVQPQVRFLVEENIPSMTARIRLPYRFPLLVDVLLEAEEPHP